MTGEASADPRYPSDAARPAADVPGEGDGSDDLHGFVPDSSPTALLLIDVINDLEFDGGDRLLPHALEAADHIAELKRRTRAAGIPSIYANDNFGRWRSDFREVVEHCLRDDVRGEPLARLLAPDEQDYFVLKPKHSAFYATTLATLLEYLGTTKLILAGYSGDICVLISAADAHMRDYTLFAPADCIASATPRQNRHALAYMQRVLDADTTESARLPLEELARRRGPESAGTHNGIGVTD